MQWNLVESNEPYTAFDGSCIENINDIMKAHWKRMDPTVIKKDPSDALFERWGVNNQLVYSHHAREGDDNEDEVKEKNEGHEYTYNYARPKDRRKLRVWNHADFTINYLGISKTGRGKSKKEKSYWIGKVYRENAHGRRTDSNLANTIAEYFGVCRATVFNNAAYSEEFDRTQAVGTQAEVTKKGRAVPKGIVGDWVLKEKITLTHWIKPWENPDDYGGRVGPITKKMDARAFALRSMQFRPIKPNNWELNHKCYV